MTLEQLKNKVHDLIGKAKIKEALDLIATWAHENNHAQLKTDVALLKSDFATLGRERTLGLVSSGESGTRQNKLTYSILNLLDGLSPEKEIETDHGSISSPPAPDLNGKLKILMLTANPAKQTQLNLEKEHSKIISKLEDRQGQFILKLKQAVNKENFKEFTEKEKPDILHFSGHGENSVGDETGGLIVQNDDRNGSSKIPPQGLKTLFKYLKKQNINLHAVILNACYSGEQAEAIAEYVQYVIGTTVNIGDTLAISFSAGFYFKLAEAGATIEDAFDSGRTQASMDGADESYFVIYKNNQKLEI